LPLAPCHTAEVTGYQLALAAKYVHCLRRSAYTVSDATTGKIVTPGADIRLFAEYVGEGKAESVLGRKLQLVVEISRYRNLDGRP